MTIARRWLPAVAVFGLVLVLWELLVTGLRIEQFILPKPSVIATTFAANLGTVWEAGLVTLREALGGLGIGVALGIVAALATARWESIREGVLPFAIAANSAPIIALAPITNQWFGITNPVSKMSVVAVIVFFPVMINMVRGLTGVDPAELELMRSYAARPRHILTRLRLPHSLPYLFNAFKVAAVLSLIGAIVSEYFGGVQGSLGQFIVQQASLLHMAEAWSGIIVGTVMGTALYLLILAAERLAMPWHVSVRATEG